PRPAPRAVERHPEPRVASVPYVVPPAAPAPVVTVAPMAPPVAAAPAPLPPVAAAPPPVILAPPPVASAQQPYTTQQPTVTVPDRTYQRVPYDPNQRAYDPNQQRPYEQHAEEMAPPPPQPQGAIGVIVNTLKPSTWFARAREFGDRIEQAGNDILPNIRPQ
ncbi:MAG: hypothetical protein QOH67_533, partial [Hyphomicrobiales bacterium]|nr:hypothetical protein [Hyphomicrobiales bacterium]